MKKTIKTIPLILSALSVLAVTPHAMANDPQKAFMDDCLQTYHNESLCLGYALGVFHTVAAIQCHQQDLQPLHTLTQSGQKVLTEGAKRVRLSIEAMQPALNKASACQQISPASSS
ncbi:hypothetical protein [Photobacterium galatheae]|uniref:Rap1a immunity protein domain-containing protein n=1 Tax=Photobacterium galatheae TaxID=1654360 RepID=A0A066RIJ5_9GAMM|nr:hypothetical protein [Photobacterium galatheae]KDM90250.1 hypothetical protein EA58_18220 [Photobacterium galatheae]MCM0151488.1 hypothetical protein [Photobacterium galatheae]